MCPLVWEPVPQKRICMDVVADKAKPRLCSSLEKESFIFGELGENRRKA